MEFEKVRNEMGRLAFVGESIIILCQTITEIFSGKENFSEKELDAVKNKSVNNGKLKERAQIVGLNFLRIKAKYY
jgi:dsRNA-specific ribonuclease